MRKLLILLLIPTTVWADGYLYNPLDKQYDWGNEVRFNPLANKSEVVAKGEIIRYDSMNNKYEYTAPNASPRYNTFERTWEMAKPDATLKRNPYSGRYSFTK